MEGQRIIVEEIAISPLRAKVTMLVPANNTMRLLNIGKLHLIDGQGEVWKQVGELGAHGNLESGLIHYYLQSNYFRKPKQLLLEIGNVQALPKDDDYVEIDIENEKVTHQPPLVDAKIRLENKGIHVVMPVKENEGNFNIFTSAEDARGEIFYSFDYLTGIKDGGIIVNIRLISNRCKVQFV